MPPSKLDNNRGGLFRPVAWQRCLAQELDVEFGLQLVRHRARERLAAADVVPGAQADARLARGVDEDALVDLRQREQLGEAVLLRPLEADRPAAERQPVFDR